MIAALFVDTGGVYFNLPDVEPWDETKDARKYRGPYPVVAHPPCQRWGKLWAGNPTHIAKTGIRKKKGDDQGCFLAALNAVRMFGGVLEHPWQSHAWPHFGLTVPPRSGGWVQADQFSGYTCCVEQGRYGHYARKPTLLLAYKAVLPDLSWGISKPDYPQWAIEKYGLARVKKLGEVALKGGGVDDKYRNGTPVEFRNVLLNIANSVQGLKSTQ